MTRAFVLLAFLLAAPSAAHADAARDFDAEARLFYRIVACAGDDAVDPRHVKIVDAHCKQMARSIAAFKKRFVHPASAFFDAVRPAGLSTQVVYPFGGGDLATALVAFPEATEVTTLSLEHAGDPTRLSALTGKQLKRYLGLFRQVMSGLLDHTDFESVELQKIERGPIPGQLAFFITGAALLGYRPVHLRFFHVAEDGAVVHYTGAEVEALADKKASKKAQRWVDTDWSVVFSNSELELEQVGDPSRTIVHRHFAANLDNDHFDGSGVEKHLEAKGAVPMITKAASYLLWKETFSAISDYVAKHLTWMVSDVTGLSVAAATAANLEQETYGRFLGAEIPANKKAQRAMIKLFKRQKFRKLKFRYGYRDTEKHVNLIITRPKATAP
jgi:hypothetical protein